MAKHVVYTCDLCERDFNFQDRYDPDSAINGMALVGPLSSWQRVRLTNGKTADICSGCCRLLQRAVDMGFAHPVRITTDLGIPFPAGATISENDVRMVLGLPLTQQPAEIINYTMKL